MSRYVVVRSADGWFATGRALGPRGYSPDLQHARIYPSLAAASAEAGPHEHVVAVERLLREDVGSAVGFGPLELVPLRDPKLGEAFLDVGSEGVRRRSDADREGIDLATGEVVDIPQEDE